MDFLPLCLHDISEEVKAVMEKGSHFVQRGEKRPSCCSASIHNVKPEAAPLSLSQKGSSSLNGGSDTEVSWCHKEVIVREG